jgi:WWE domain
MCFLSTSSHFLTNIRLGTGRGEYSYKPLLLSGSPSEGRGLGMQDEREMFLAKLLVGNEILINRDESSTKAAECRSLTVPPVNPRTGLRYNTVTGFAGGSQIWVVYENGRAYPDYLVRYYRGNRDQTRTPFESKTEASSHKLTLSATTTSLDDDSTGSNTAVDVESCQPSPHFVWEFLDNTGWKEYGTVQASVLENTYQEYLKDPTIADQTAQLCTSEWTYEVDVVAMTQTNMQHPSRRVRDVRRSSDVMDV